jgi:signal transduction histidine kinase
MAKHSVEGTDAAQLREELGKLKSLIEEQLAEIHDLVQHSTEVAHENTEEVGVLRDAIDELRELYQWALNNGRQDVSHPFRLTSMPVDPTASDWAERVNKVTAADLPQELDRPTAVRYQGTLWSFDQ